MDVMRSMTMVFVLAAFSACAAQSVPTLLSAPLTSKPGAGRHNEEGIHAYNLANMEEARQHFEEAISVDADLAEAHYNLGMALYRLRNVGEGDKHFIRAANLAPGNKVIWNAPPLRNAAPAEKDLIQGASDGHMHSH